MPTAPRAPRPRTTTRDPAELQRRLAAWVADWLPGAAVGGLTVPPSNGMSSETVLFDLQRPEGTVQPCVLRLAADTNAYAVFPHYDMERQYRAIQLVAERTKVPVPRLLRLETDPADLGLAAYGVTDHAARFTLDGEVGHGIFEHGSFGRHDPSGFAGFGAVAP